MGNGYHEHPRTSAAFREDAIMIVLRLIALLAGALILILPPLVTPESGQAGMPGWKAVGGLAGLALVAASFIYIAAFGNRMRRSRSLRVLGGLLLMIPAIAGAAIVVTRTDEPLLWGGAGLLSITVMLFVSFIYPAVPERRQRPMRRRERSEPSLILIQRHPSAERRGSGI
jgi:peptidoglycan/LPS O-acetylase OafA/YrhL